MQEITHSVYCFLLKCDFLILKSDFPLIFFSSYANCCMKINTLRIVINHAASYPNVELKCMYTRYKCYVLINYISVCVSNCVIAIKIIIIVHAMPLKWGMAWGRRSKCHLSSILGAVVRWVHNRTSVHCFIVFRPLCSVLFHQRLTLF